MALNSSRFGGYAAFGDGSSSVILEVASTPDAKTRGLSGRKAMPECCGMLFTGLSGGAFWMKGCLIPLDIVFIKDGRVSRVYSMQADGGEKLYRYGDETEAIELAYGFCRRHSVDIGSEVEVRLWK